MKHISRSGVRGAAWLALGLLILAPRPGSADALTGYSVQVLAQLGQKAGDFTPTGSFQFGQMNDNGEFVFTAGGGALVQYANGKFTPIAVAGGPSPDGKTWPNDLGFVLPPGISMNEAGNVVFEAGRFSDGRTLGIYFWDAKQQTLTPVAAPGTAIVNNLSFMAGNAGGWATINNHDEIAFGATVKPAGAAAGWGIFLRHADGRIQAVALPGDPLPGKAGKVLMAADPSINDAGEIAFTAGGNAVQYTESYLWENGTLSVIADPSTPIPGFGAPVGAQPWSLNNKDGSVIFGAAKKNPASTSQFLWGVYLWNQGQFTTVVAPGEQMPGGGTFQGYNSAYDVDFPNQAGQYPFVLTLDDHGVTTNAAYVTDTAGHVSLIAKSGMTTDLGTITQIDPGQSSGIGINTQGQIVLTAQIKGGPDALLLLTPKAP